MYVLCTLCCKQYGVDSVLVTAGEHKAGLDMTNEVTLKSETCETEML
jgi:hypothetical protein